MLDARILGLIDRYDALAGELEQSVLQRVNAALDAAYRDLERQLRQTYPKLQSEGSLIAAQRKLLVMDELGSLLDLLQGPQADAYEQLLQDLINDADALGGEAAAAYLSAIDPTSPIANHAGIPLEAVALQARDGRQRLYRYSDEFRNQVSAIVEQGLIQGWGTGRVQRLMRQQLGVTKSKAETLARTEMSRSLNNGAQMRYERSGVEYVQWMITPSEQLCRICAARNGYIYEVGKVEIPAHPRCRCQWLPVSQDWIDNGLIDADFIADYRQQGLDLLKQNGQKPDNGPTYWEKQAGATAAPTPVWKPKELQSAITSQPSKPAKKKDSRVKQQSTEPLQTTASASRRKTDRAENVVRSMSSAKTHVDKLRNQGGQVQEDLSMLEFYTGDRFLEVNQQLRSGNPTDDVKQEVQRVNRALDKMPAYEGVVYRGIRPDSIGEIDGILAQFRQGESVVFPGFTSTSASESVGRNYAGLNGIGGVTVAIRSKGVNGRVVAPISRNPAEQEVLFKSNTRFRVVRVEEGEKLGIRSAIVVIEEDV
ncbi:MAG: minor capsid protein [Cyanobacteria bacterium J06648_16]